MHLNLIKISYKTIMKTVMTVIEDSYFLKVDVQYLEKLLNLHNDLPFLPKIIKIEKGERLQETCMIIK